MSDQQQQEAPQISSDELARLTAEFLARGCEIAVCAHGESGIEPSFGGTKMERQATLNRIERQRQATTKADAKLVTALREFIDGGSVGEPPKMPFSRLRRIVETYFEGDERATALLPLNQTQRAEVRAKETLPKVKAAVEAGVIGLKKIAKHIGEPYTYVSKLNQQFNLNLPKEPPGFGRDK